MQRLAAQGAQAQGKQRAFSLVELLVTMVVIGVVVGIAMPSFKSQLSRSGAEALSQDLLTALQLARTEAIKRANFVSLCPSTNGTSCSGDANGWAQGFIAVVDYAANENSPEPVLQNAANPAIVLRVWERQNAKAVLEVLDSTDVAATPVPASGSRSFIRFTRLGTLREHINSAQGIVIKTKMKAKDTTSDSSENCEPRSARLYTVGPIGMVRLVNQDCW